MIRLFRIALVAGMLAAGSALTAASAGAGAVFNASAATPNCNVNGLWTALVNGGRSQDKGTAEFQIFNQQVESGDDSQGDDNDDNGVPDQDDPVLNPQTLSPDDLTGDDNDDNGLTDQDDVGNGQGQTSTFQWKTVAVNFLQTAQGSGVLFVPTNPTVLNPVRWAVFGTGNHPTYGGFDIQAQGTLTCVAGQGQAPASGTFRLDFNDGTSDSGTIPTLARGEL